jgi:hypothetical protein
MPRKLRERLTYANVMSTLAIFLTLGTGTAYATHLVVNSSDVVDESLVSADLKNGLAVKSADITNDSVTGADVKEGTLGQARPRRSGAWAGPRLIVSATRKPTPAPVAPKSRSTFPRPRESY